MTTIVLAVITAEAAVEGELDTDAGATVVTTAVGRLPTAGQITAGQREGQHQEQAQPRKRYPESHQLGFLLVRQRLFC